MVWGPTRRPGALALAAALAAAVFGLRLLDPDPANGLTFLYVAPILVIAFGFGRVGGLVAGLGAIGLFTLGNAITDTPIDAAGYVSRGVILVAIGLIGGETAKRLREALASARAGARHFELARDMLATVDAEGRFVELSGSWESCLGWPLEELKGRPFMDLVHPDDRARTEAEAALLAADNASSNFSNRYRTADGDWRWIEWSSQLDPEQGVIYAAARDISERVTSERARLAAEERFRQIFEGSPNGMAVVGVGDERQHQILEANDRLAELLGVPLDEVIGSNSLVSYAHPDDVERLTEGIREVAAAPGQIYRDDVRIVRPDGKSHWVRLTTSVIHDGTGRPAYRLSQLADIEARKQAELELEREREFKGALLESLNAAVLATDGDGELTFINRAAREWRFGHEELGEWALERVRRPDGSPLPADQTPMARALEGEVVRHAEIGLVTEDGLRTLLVNGQPIVNSRGDRLGAVVAGDDITERKHAEEMLRHLADHDPLSGAFNRRRFERELERELAHGHGRGRAVVLVLDVDDFKAINDTLGHATGDAVIAKIGDTLDARLRTSDVVARIGGDEFAVILRRTTLDEARAVADSIRDRLGEELSELVGPPLGRVEVSVGMASIEGERGLDADEVLKRADRAMYAAKRAGDGRVAVG